MREILFRGKRVDNGEWLYGSSLLRSCDDEFFMTKKGDVGRGTIDKTGNIIGVKGMTFYKVIPESVGHYIGITDKNGKRIFEGDILNAPHWWWGCGYVYLTRVSKGYGHADSVLQYILAENVEDPLKNATYNLWNGSEVEVIGNIHDNPELLAKNKMLTTFPK